MKERAYSPSVLSFKAGRTSWWYVSGLITFSTIGYGQSAGAPTTRAPTVAPLSAARLVQLNREWGGIWEMESGQSDFSAWKSIWDWSGGKGQAPNPPPLTVKWQRIYDDIRAKAVQGKNVADFTSACVPYGFPSISFFPEEFQFTRDSLNILSWGNLAYRHVYMDGRKHPHVLALTYNGHSVGHWDRDTLVIDTVGFRDDSLVDTGLTHTTELHVIERMKILKSNDLEVEFTFADPQEFVHPWVVKRIYERVTEVRISAAPDCADNRFALDESGASIMLDSTGKPLAPTSLK